MTNLEMSFNGFLAFVFNALAIWSGFIFYHLIKELLLELAHDPDRKHRLAMAQKTTMTVVYCALLVVSFFSAEATLSASLPSIFKILVESAGIFLGYWAWKEQWLPKLEARFVAIVMEIDWVQLSRNYVRIIRESFQRT